MGSSPSVYSAAGWWTIIYHLFCKLCFCDLHSTFLRQLSRSNGNQIQNQSPRRFTRRGPLMQLRLTHDADLLTSYEIVLQWRTVVELERDAPGRLKDSNMLLLLLNMADHGGQCCQWVVDICTAGYTNKPRKQTYNIHVTLPYLKLSGLLTKKRGNDTLKSIFFHLIFTNGHSLEMQQKPEW